MTVETKFMNRMWCSIYSATIASLSALYYRIHNRVPASEDMRYIIAAAEETANTHENEVGPGVWHERMDDWHGEE